MDRFALAIQETLRIYDISPDRNSARNNLWVSFPTLLQELMLPLLSSRYTMVQSNETINISPIYKSSIGGSFQSWLHK